MRSCPADTPLAEGNRKTPQGSGQALAGRSATVMKRSGLLDTRQQGEVPTGRPLGIGMTFLPWDSGAHAEKLTGAVFRVRSLPASRKAWDQLAG